MTTVVSEKAATWREKHHARDVLQFDRKLTPTAVRVGVLLLRHFNMVTERCDPGIDRLARVLGCDRASVFRALTQLEKRGYFRRWRHAGVGLTNSYEPNWQLFQAKSDQFAFSFAHGLEFDAETDRDTTTKPTATKAQPVAETTAANTEQVAAVQPDPSQPCDLTRCSGATQNPERKPEKKTGSLLSETARKLCEQTAAAKANWDATGSRKPQSFQQLQRHLMLPIPGGRTAVAAPRRKPTPTSANVLDNLAHTALQRAIFTHAGRDGALAGHLTDLVDAEVVAAEKEKRGKGIALLFAKLTATKGAADVASAAA